MKKQKANGDKEENEKKRQRLVRVGGSSRWRHHLVRASILSTMTA